MIDLKIIESAMQGNIDAQRELGDCCYHGTDGVEKDYEEAVKWYRKAAEQGDSLAQLMLGTCYQNGEGVSRDFTEALKWFQRASEQGNSVTKSMAKSMAGILEVVRNINKRAEPDNADTPTDTDKEEGQDLPENASRYYAAAMQGDAEAQFHLGDCYYWGDGVEIDYAEALKWYQRAAEQENSDAQYALGFCYQSGTGVDQNYDEAIKWYQKAAAQGNSDAQTELGDCYYEGRGVIQDYSEAVKWYKKAAEQGDEEAQDKLINCNINGYGVEQEYAQAPAPKEDSSCDDNKTNNDKEPEETVDVDKKPDPEVQHDESFNSSFDLDQELAGIIGLEKVKKFLKNQQQFLIANEKLKKAGSQTQDNQSLNMIFLGNPGTGKTTIARIVAKMLKEMGILSNGQLVEASRADLIGGYEGQTAIKTEKKFKSALGGVLFIDEAYSLVTAYNDSYGKECVDTLVKLIEDNRGDIVVILAGYTELTKHLLETNPGLNSRFPEALRIEFPDYSAEELIEIGKVQLKQAGLKLTTEAGELFEKEIIKRREYAAGDFGNGRMVRNYIDEVVRQHHARIAEDDIPEDQLTTILAEDVVPEQERERKERSENYNLEDDLKEVIGLERVKDYVRKLSESIQIQEIRKQLGQYDAGTDTTTSMHMIFIGNPGTGKTMMARKIASMLYHVGAIKENKVVEVDREKLVGGYIGQSEGKTKDVINGALGGVLFIDEAYSLGQGGGTDYGKRVIEVLIKMMEDHRNDLVVILAGYKREMEKFLSVNSGLKSRFPNVIEFDDYSAEELLQIAKENFNKKRFKLTDKAETKLKDLFRKARNSDNFGNGRYVRNMCEKIIENQSHRLIVSINHGRKVDKEFAETIIEEDIPDRI